MRTPSLKTSPGEDAGVARREVGLTERAHLQGAGTTMTGLMEKQATPKVGTPLLCVTHTGGRMGPWDQEGVT